MTTDLDRRSVRCARSDLEFVSIIVVAGTVLRSRLVLQPMHVLWAIVHFLSIFQFF